MLIKESFYKATISKVKFIEEFNHDGFFIKPIKLDDKSEVEEEEEEEEERESDNHKFDSEEEHRLCWNEK